MNFNNTIKNIFLITITLFLFTACGGGGGASNSSYNNQNAYNTANGEEIILGSSNPICKTGSATQEGQIRDIDTNRGIANVTITIDGCSTTTDTNGLYKLSHIPSSSRRSLTLNKNGYYKNSEVISIDNETSNYLEFKMEKFSSWNPTLYSSKEGKDIGFITIPSNVTYTVNSNSYDGNVTAYYRNLKTTTEHGRDLFPGTFEGLDTNNIIVPFISYDFFVLDLKDDNNNALTISGTISIKITDVQETNAQVIPLWYYDFNRGIWVEDGTAQRDENGDYLCEISHTGTWSISQPIETETGIYKGRIVNAEGQPISHIRVSALGKNWIAQDFTTDENGIFTLNVIPNKRFKLKAYDYKNRFGATSKYMLDAVASGEVVENRL